MVGKGLLIASCKNAEIFVFATGKGAATDRTAVTAERNRPNLQIQFHRNGAMVGPHDLGINVGHLHLFTRRFAHQEIVDTPPCVIGAGMETVAPPGIAPSVAGFK